jgi:type I restriction enzyme S subunit
VSSTYYSALKDSRKPRRGDVLFSAVGATLGIAAEVDTDDQFCFQCHIALIRPNPDAIKPNYLCHMLQSGDLHRLAWSSITGTAQPTVPLRAIRKFVLPVPPLPEQRRIVAHLDALRAKADALRSLQSETAADLDALLPAVLAAAFAGQL